MVASIEEQIHQFLIKQEEQRCRAIEATKADNEKVKRKAIPKPWTRVSPLALCQENDLLLMVTDYDYDLSDEAFQDYCLTRGILHATAEKGSKRWQFFVEHRRSKDEYLADPYFRFAQEVNGQRHRYTDEQMETGWTVMLLGRAKVQDCWELHTRQVAGKGA